MLTLSSSRSVLRSALDVPLTARLLPIARTPCASCRGLSTATDAQAQAIELSSPVTYISQSHDPWFNLSYEDWLLRNTPVAQPVLFLYRNDPCVVIGRNQNPWKETSPRGLRERKLPLVRRRSGGGTVYHDLGNTNFSIILPRLLFTRSHGAELIARAVREKLGVPKCTVNDRNDVIVRDSDRDLKVSGSAYKIVQHRAYHHGTMLISSDLEHLGSALRSDSPNLETKGIASFRSPVTTLNHFRLQDATPIDHTAFVLAAQCEFGRVYPGNMEVKYVDVSDADVAANERVNKGVEELKSWAWQYGQTPEFTNRLSKELSFGTVSVSVGARHAVITDCSISTSGLDGTVQAALDEVAQAIVGARYESLEGVEERLVEGEGKAMTSEVLDWLRASM